MNKLLSIALLLCLFSAAVLAATVVDETSEDRIEYRYSIMFARSEAHKIGMEAVLDYLGDDKTEALETSYDNFVGYYDDLETAKNDVDFDALWATRLLMIDEAKDFRTEAKTIIGEDMIAVRAAVTAARAENEDYLASLEKDVYDDHIVLLFAAFDSNVEIFEEKFAKLEEKGLDPGELEGELDEIKDRRTELGDKVDDAYDACIGDLILACDSDEYTDYQDFRYETREKFKELRANTNKFMHRGWIDATRKRVDDALAKLDEHEDIDTTEFEAALNDILTVMDEAEAALDEEDFDVMKKKLHDSRDLFKEYAQDARDILKATRHNARLDSLGATINKTETLIQDLSDKGADTSDHEAELANAKTALASAETLCDAGDYDGCADELKSVLESLKAIKALSRPMPAAKFDATKSGRVKSRKPIIIDDSIRTNTDADDSTDDTDADDDDTDEADDDDTDDSNSTSAFDVNSTGAIE